MDTAASQSQLRQSALALRHALVCVTRASEAIEVGDIVFAEDILVDLEVELVSALECAEATW